MDQAQSGNGAPAPPEQAAGGGCLKLVLAYLLATAPLAAWHAYREASEKAARGREEMLEPLRRSMKKLEDDSREGRPNMAGEATRRLLGVTEREPQQGVTQREPRPEKPEVKGPAARGDDWLLP